MATTITPSTSVVLVSTKNTSTIVYLPNISTVGKLITIRDNEGYASIYSSITISTLLSASFYDGSTNLTINQPYGFITLNTYENGVYGIVNTFAFQTGQSAASVNSLTTSTIQMFDSSTGNINTLYSSNSQLYINSTMLGTVTGAQLTSTINGLGSSGYLSSLSTVAAIPPLWVSVGFGSNYNTGTGATLLDRTSSIMYSQDGFTWTSAVNGFNRGGKAVVYGVPQTGGPPLYVAVGQDFNYPYTGFGSYMRWSADGINWNSAAFQLYSDFETRYCAGYGNGIFISGGATNFQYSNSILWSADGKIWNTATTPYLYNSVLSVAYGNGIWVAANVQDASLTNGPVGAALWSTDGKTWNNANTTSWFSDKAWSVVFDGTKFICAVDSGSNVSASNIAYSYDGSNWSSAGLISGNFGNYGGNSGIRSIGVATPIASTPPGPSPGSPSPTLVLTTNNISSVGQAIWYSMNGGYSWSNDTSFSSTSGLLPTSAPYYDGSKWWLGFTKSNTTGNRMAYSMDGRTWISDTLVGGFSNSIINNPLGPYSPAAWGYVAVGGGSNANAQVISTVLGLQQSFQTSSLQASTLQVGSVLQTLNVQQTTPTQWVAVGSGVGRSTIQTSTDGLQWTPVTQGGFSSGGYGASYNGSLWVTVGNNGGTVGSIQVSSNGLTWSSNTSGGFASTGYCVGTNGLYFLAGGNNATQLGSIQKSTYGLSWTSNTNGGFTTDCRGIAYNGSYWIATGNNGGTAGSIQKSTDGLTWSSNATGGFSVLGNGVAWNGSLWVAVGSNGSSLGTIQVSRDGTNWSNIVSGGFSSYGYGIAYNGYLWVAVGSNTPSAGNIKISQDGLNWSNATGGFSNEAYGITHNGSFWAAVGNGGSLLSSIQVSVNGSNWSTIQSGGFTPSGFGIAYSKPYKPDIATTGLNFYTSGQPFTTNQQHQIRTSGDILSIDYTLFVDKSNNRVGINTPNPQTSLDVSGPVTVQGSLSVSSISRISYISSINITATYKTLYYNPTNGTIGYVP